MGEFRFVDVVEAAMRLVRECCEFSKTRLGGVATLGVKSFFVTVDGPPEVSGGGGGNETVMVGLGGGVSAVNVDSTLASRRFFA